MEYASAPSSAKGLSEISSLSNDKLSGFNNASSPKARKPQHPRSSFASVGSRSSMSQNAASLLSPRISPGRGRAASIDTPDASGMLPRIYNKIDTKTDQAPKKPTRTSIMRAAESGKGSLLPMRGVSKLSPMRTQPASVKSERELPSRSRSSGPSYSTGLPRTQQDVGGEKSKLAYLRRRTANASSDDEFDASSQKTQRMYKSFDESSDPYSRGGRRKRGSTGSVGSTGSGGTNYTTNNNNSSISREHHSPNKWGNGLLCQKQLNMLSRMKLGHLLQVAIVFAVVVLVYESHLKALGALEQLKQFKSEESMLLLHLRKIEQQSIQLHENFSRLAQADRAAVNSGGSNNIKENVEGEDGATIDFYLIRQQIKQLKQMEDELGHEVKTLQTRIQLSARNHIIQEFGEGPVQVILELDFGGEDSAKVKNTESTNKISILLWHDTPHAAWTWLEQIGNNVWDGAAFNWHQGNIVDAVPSKKRIDPEREGTIQFVEQSQHSHQAWTVGVREHPNDKGSVGGSSLGMYINLQDNSKLHRHETCVGKIIDGFDVLQKLLEAARNNHENSSSVVIRKATAMHYVTKKAGMG